MAPTKRKAELPPSAARLARVTRSSAKLSAASSVPCPAVDLTEKKVNKKAKKEMKKEKKVEIDEVENVPDETENGGVLEASEKTIVIEHCKQCTQFRKRAYLVKEGLEKRFSGITVILNPEKPRRGCFEIREEGGKTFISLLDMKRPFKPMKDLDMEKVISDIIDQISSTS